MKDFGIVQPGSTLYIEFDSFGADGESLTLTGLAVTDVEVYKNGGTTQRSSDNGYTLLDTDGIDFDAVTGIHGLSISLADNSDAGFWAAGAHYRVVIASVTINTQTVSFTAATFRIGYPAAVLNTTIATLASQTSFTLSAGPAEDDALNGMGAVIHDVASAVQHGFVRVSDYTGSTKTVTLAAGATFTAAATDNFSLIGFHPAVVLDEDMTGHQTQGTLGQTIGDSAADTNTIFKATVTDASGATVGADTTSIVTATNAGGVATKTADSATLTTGTNTSGSYTDTATDDNTYWITQPASVAVGGFGLRQQLVFELPLGRVPTAIFLRGYWNGTSVVNLYALHAVNATYDSLTNTGTNLVSRTTETGYTFMLPRDYADDTGGSFNIVTLEFRATSTNTANRMRIDQILIAHVAEDIATDISVPTTADIWNYADRTLTEPGVEPITPPTAAAITTAVLTTAMTEAYATDGAAPTLAQALFAIQQFLQEKSVSSTTLTVKKLDGSTTAMTFTLGDATTPTSITRAS